MNQNAMNNGPYKGRIAELGWQKRIIGPYILNEL
jgi:hypothetical protein